MTSLFRYLLALGLICLSLDWTVAHAEDPHDISQDVIDFFDTVGMVEPDIAADTIDLPESVTSVREIVEATAMVDEQRLQSALTGLQNSSFSTTERGATILEFGQALATALQAEAGESGTDPLSETLEGFLGEIGMAAPEDVARFRDAWEAAYLATPHGAPVRLADV